MSFKLKTLASEKELENRNALTKLYDNSPIEEAERLANLGVYLKRQEFTKMLFFNDLYQQFKSVHGVIMEFGVRWGQNLVTLNNLRGIHEPYNHSRKILGFDTFSGFEDPDSKDGDHEVIEKGAFSVTEGYEEHLSQVLACHENEAPLPHIKKNTILKGDATTTLRTYLKDHPETIIAFAYFDFDVYTPTKECLQLIKPYLTKGAIVGFDELNDAQFPGETVALREVMGTVNIEIKRSQYSGAQSYFVVK